MMTTRSPSLQGLNTVFGCALILSLVGCDYWPPALQAQIEQMRSETQTLAIEKAQLQGQVMDLSKAKQEYQSQVDELSRMNHEKSAMITSLQKQLDAVRIRAMKSMSSQATQRKATVRATTKPSAKAAPKRSRKEAPSTKKSVSKGVGGQ